MRFDGTSLPSASVIAWMSSRNSTAGCAAGSTVIGLQHIGDAALAGLRVDADDRFVGAADVLGSIGR